MSSAYALGAEAAVVGVPTDGNTIGEVVRSGLDCEVVGKVLMASMVEMVVTIWLVGRLMVEAWGRLEV
jgi:hypothetical protein